MTITFRPISMLSLVLPFALILGSSSPASAQQRRGGVVKDLLKDLIESQLRKDQRQRTGPRTNLGPARPPIKMTAEQRQQLKRLKPLAAKYVNTSARLATGMNDELGRSPALRPLIVQALQLNASASALAKRLDGDISPEVLSRSLRQMDQEHRQLGFRIGQITPAPRNCVRDLAELDGIRDQVTGLYQLEPQINLQGVNDLAAALSVTLDALVEDVGVELRSNQGWRELLLQGRRVQSQCRSFRFSCSEATGREPLVNEYETFASLWRPYADRLESFNNPYLARQIRRAHDLNRQVAQQLLIPIGVDRTRARHLSELIDEELRTLFGYINLNVLAALPEGNTLPTVALELKLQVKSFQDCVANNQAPPQMKKRWQAMHRSWTAFTYQLDSIRNKRIRTVAQEIDSSVLALRDVLGIVPTFDRRQVTRLAGLVDSLSEQMQVQVERWARRGSAPKNVNRSVRDFHNLAHRFHDSTLDGRAPNQLLSDCDSIVTEWRQLHPRLSTCRSPEAVALSRLTDELTVSLVKLETLLAQ